MNAKNLNTLTILTASLLLSCAAARAQVIYSNNFSLGDAVNISSTPPTVANSFAGGTNNAVWQDMLASDTGALLQNGLDNSPAGTSWLLPFKPEAGHIYLLEATVTFTNNPGNWIGLGFAQNNTIVASGSARYADAPAGVDFAIITEATGNVQWFGGPKTALQQISQNGFFPPGPGTNTIQILLNTESSLWSIAAYVNGKQVATSYTYTANPTIGAVGLTQNSLTVNPNAVQWNDFSLSTALQPFIIKQPPASQIVAGGSSYTNSVTVLEDTNGGALFYQWYAGGVPLVNGGSISGANTNVLVINPISPSDQFTNYYVIVTNDYGSVTSSLASVTVLTNPVVTDPAVATNPITLFAGSGGNVGSSPTFSVSAIGAQPLVYQWLTNGVAVDGATNASFTFANCQTDSPTNFACVVANSFGGATNTWLATYLPAPVAPYPQAVLTSQPVAFWRLNEPDNGLNDGNPGAICHDYQSGNNGTYTNIFLGQAGYNPAEPAETSVEIAPGSFPLYSYAGHIQGVDFAVTNGGNAEFTVEAWASCFGDVPGSPVVSEGTYDKSEEFGLGSDTNTTTMYQFYVRAANGTVYKADSSIPVNDAAWHHLVGICDEANSNVSLYVDGTLAATTFIPPNSGIFEASSPLAIGAGIISGKSDYTLEFNGNISDVAAYNYALSGAQVVEHYASLGNPVSVALISPPANIVYQANQTLTISAAASGSGPLGYYWTNVTVGGVLDSGSISTSGGLDATLTIPNAPGSLSGDQLELVATNAFSSINAFVTLYSPAIPVTLDYSSSILYSNYFDGGTWSLAGMPLTAANSLVGGTNTTWVDALGTNATGILQASGVDASKDRDSWVVPFTPHAGYVYALTASLTFNGNPGSWVGLGFAQNVPTNAAVGYGRFSDGGTTPPQMGPNGYDWLILTEANGKVQYFAGPGGQPQAGLTNAVLFTAGAGTHTVQVVLDTTGAQWVQYAYVDGNSTGTNTYDANPPIGAVGITQNTLGAPGNVQWNNFALTQVAPGGVPPYTLDSLPASVTLQADTSLSLPATIFGSAPFGYYWSNTNTAAVLASGATNDMAPLSADLAVSDVPGSWNGNTLALVITNAFGTNIALISLNVTGAVNLNPTNIVVSMTGNQMTLSWPTDYTGWQLQSNSVGLTASDAWFDVSDSTTTNKVTIIPDTTKTNVFYRLIYQP